MQFSGDTALQTAIESNQRTIFHEFMVDWNRNGLYDHSLSDLTEVCESISLERGITGSLPAETTLIEGFSAAQLTVSLGGRRSGDVLQLAQALSPYRTDSPLYGVDRGLVPCKWSVGVRTSTGSNPLIRKFTGYLVTPKVESKSRTVTLICRDGVELLHKQLNLPLFAHFDYQLPITSQRINSQWVIDYALRQNGIYQSPPMSQGCIFSVTGHGGMIPERGHQARTVGVSGVLTESDPIYVPGRWGIAYNGGSQFCSFFAARANGQFAPVPGWTWVIQFQAFGDSIPLQRNPNGEPVVTLGTGRSTLASGSTTMRVRVDRTGLVWVDFYNGSTQVFSRSTSSVSLSGWTNVFISVDFLGATLNNCNIGAPNFSSNGNDLSGLSLNPITLAGSCTVSYAAPYPVQNIQISGSTSISAATMLYDTAFASQCDLDPGLNEFYSLPVIRGEDSWELLKSVVGAEYGVIGFSEQGRLYFKNRDTARRQNLAINRTLTADNALGDLILSDPAGQIRNSISTQTNVLLRGSKLETVWSIKDPTELPLVPGTTYFTFIPDHPGSFDDLNENQTGSQLAWDTFTDVATKFVVVNQTTLAEISGVIVNYFVDYVAQEQGLDQILVKVDMPGVAIGMFATTTGQPAFKYGAFVASNRATVTQAYKRQSSIDKYGEQVLKLDSGTFGRWWQIQSSIQRVALGLLKDLKRPTSILEPIPIPGDPRLQLQDTVRVRDDHGLGGPIDCGVLLIRTSWTNGKLEDTLTLKPFAPAGTWILGHPDRSILGVTTTLG